MNFKGILRVTSSYLYILSGLIFVGLLVSCYFHFQDQRHYVTYAFLQAFCLTLFAATVLNLSTKTASTSLQLREAILSVLLIWIVSIIFCALPFSLSGALESHLDSWFETVSGLTTTGATVLQAKNYNALGEEIPIHTVLTGFQKIEYTFFGTVKPVIDSATGKVLLTGVEAFPKALLFWRSLLAWIGGAGMVLLFVALLPALGQEAKKLFRYESTGPSFSPLFPKARQTALVLLKIYLALTLLCIVSLMLTNPALSFFEALNIAFSTISTGGFSTKNASLAAYGCVATEIVAMVFMIAGAINFSYYYEILRGRLYKLRDPEFVMFFVILFALSFIVAINLTGSTEAPLVKAETSSSYSFFESIRYGFFQVISCMTTTGFATANYDSWPFFSQALMIVSLFCGGMSGSTCAGLKIIRVCILWQCLRYAIHSVFKRTEVRVIRLGGREIDSETSFGVLAFFLTMMVTSLVGVLLLVYANIDLETAFGLNASMINNSGAAFRVGGPQESCAFLSPFSKGVCILWMLLGRFEFYAWFTLLIPSFWQNR